MLILLFQVFISFIVFTITFYNIFNIIRKYLIFLFKKFSLIFTLKIIFNQNLN